MKIAIIGSTSLKSKMLSHAHTLQDSGHSVRLPYFDTSPFTELELCQKNLSNIKWADRIDIIWDQRSSGTILDFGFTMALNKPITLVYLEPKTLTRLIMQYKEAHDNMGGDKP